MNGLELKTKKAMAEESIKKITSENKIEKTLNYDMLTKKGFLYQII